MKKKELITAVAAKRQLKQKDAAALVDDVLNVIAEALQSGDSVTIPGFGGSVRHAAGTTRRRRKKSKFLLPKCRLSVRASN